MTATGLVVWVGTVWGLVQIVTLSRLFRPIREALGGRETFFGFLSQCAMCFGFWAGVWFTMIGVASPAAIITPGWFPLLARILLDGCLGSAVCYGLLVVQVALGSERL